MTNNITSPDGLTMKSLMELLVSLNGSDLHLIVGTPPTIRVGGKLSPVEGVPILTDAVANRLIGSILTKEQAEFVEENKELDFGYQYEDKGRFRINVYYSQGHASAALRLIPAKVKTIDELGLPQIYHQFTQYTQGLVLITGPTGEGKSTSLAAMIDEINKTKADHILTIEDPVEFIHRPVKSIISQREVNRDTKSWGMALRSALREDPDVVLVGEMRDFETIAAAITLAETGHLVFATLHTATAAQTVDRIIDVFPSHQQDQVRVQLAGTLKAVASQRLVEKTDGGLVAAIEIMTSTAAVRTLIRENKVHQIDNVILTSSADGMMLIESHLAQMLQQGLITKDNALKAAFRPKELARLLGE